MPAKGMPARNGHVARTPHQVGAGEMPPRAAVVIAGAGIAGLSLAFELARRRVDVLVLERDRIGAGAGGVAAGMLGPASEAEHLTEPLMALAQESLRRYPEWVHAVEAAGGHSCGLRQEGTLFVALSRDDEDEIARLVRFQERYGVAGQWLSPDQVEALEPNLSPRITGALRLPDDHQVDPQAMLAALACAVTALGGRIVTGAAVTGFETAGGRLREVVGHFSRVQSAKCKMQSEGTGSFHLGTGGDSAGEPQSAAVAQGLAPHPSAPSPANPPDAAAVARGLVPRPSAPAPANPPAPGQEIAPFSIQCDAAVLAAGAWSSRDLAWPAAPLGIRPVKGQLLHLQGPELIRHVVRTPHVYLVPRAGGRLVVGGTMEEQGFDATPTAGAVMDLLWAARLALPAVYDLALAGVRVGFRPAARDHLPLIGETSVPGLYAATGYFRHGVLLAPATAMLLADLLVAGTLSPLLAPFRPDRAAAAPPVGTPDKGALPDGAQSVPAH